MYEKPCQQCRHWIAREGLPHGIVAESVGRCQLHEMICSATHSCRFWNTDPPLRYDD